MSVKASPTFYETVILKFLDGESVGCVYDIGVGPKSEYETLFRAFPTMKFFGLEAYPPTFEALVSKFPGEVLNMAVSETGAGSTVEFIVHEPNLMASGLIGYDNDRGGRRIRVPSITLDEFDRRMGEHKGVLLWMDIEGYELKALKSGERLLKSGRVKLLNLEVRTAWNNKSAACTEDEVDEYLARFGYEKKFVYNHYPQSRHHDAIYVLHGHKLPDTCAWHVKFYAEIVERLNSANGPLDLALGLIDANIAVTERDQKIAYLRSKMK